MTDLFSKLKTDIEKTKQVLEQKSFRRDTRFLNYFELDHKKNQTITIRFLPINDSGEIFKQYSIHKHPNKDLPDIVCSYASNGERCAVCNRSYEAYQSGDTETQKLLNKSNKTLAQVVIVKSDIDIDEAEDGNLVKLMHVPYGIVTEVLKSIDNGIVADIMGTNFVIKRAIGKNKRANYDNSFFNINDNTEIPAEFVESFNNGTSYLYDINKEIPPDTRSADMEEWLQKALTIGTESEERSASIGDAKTIDKVLKSINNSSSDSSDSVEDSNQKTTSTSDELLAMLNAR